MVCATESPARAPGPPPASNFEGPTDARAYCPPPHLRGMTPLERAAKLVHEIQPEPLEVVYVLSSPGRKPRGESRRLCHHLKPRRICLDCHADRHRRFQRVLIMLAQQQLGPVDGYAAAVGCDVYQRIECWEAWSCGFWPWWQGLRRKKSMEAASNDFRCFRWFCGFDAQARLRWVKQSRKWGCDRLERRRSLRRMITEAGNFHVSDQMRQGDGAVGH